MVPFPFLLAISKRSVRKLCSSSLCSKLSGFFICWKGPLSGTRFWEWLTESGLVGVEVLVESSVYWFGLQFGTSLLCRFISWTLGHQGYGLVVSHCRHLGSTGLFFSLLVISSSIMICLFWGHLDSPALTLLAWRLRTALRFLTLLCTELLLSGYFATALFSRPLCMIGSIRFHWHWSCLGVIRLVGVDVQVVLVFWVCSLQFRLSKWRSCLVWKSISFEVSLVFTRVAH